MGSTPLHTLRLETITLTYRLERKNVKNLNLRVRRDGGVCVSAHPRVPLPVIEDFLRSRERFLLRALERVREQQRSRPAPRQYVTGEAFYILGKALPLQVSAGAEEEVSSDGERILLRTRTPEDFSARQRLVTRYLDRRCREVFGAALAECCPAIRRYGVALPALRIRDMETRWGSCLVGKGVVTLNKRLLGAPWACITYVVMHELCHFVHPDHSKRFYGLLTQLMPDWRERRDLLNSAAARQGGAPPEPQASAPEHGPPPDRNMPLPGS